MPKEEDFCGRYQRMKQLQVQTTLLNKIEDLEKSVQHLTDENIFLKALICSIHEHTSDWCSKQIQNIADSLIKDDEASEEKFRPYVETKPTSSSENHACDCKHRIDIFEKDIKLLIQRIHALEAKKTNEIQPEDLGSSSKESVPIPDELTKLKLKETEEFTHESKLTPASVSFEWENGYPTSKSKKMGKEANRKTEPNNDDELEDPSSSGSEGISDSDTISDGELEWLEEDLLSILKSIDYGDKAVHLVKDVYTQLWLTRDSNSRNLQNNGIKNLRNGYITQGLCSEDFQRTKAKFAELTADYNSDSDSDYVPEAEDLNNFRTDMMALRTVAESKEDESTTSSSDSDSATIYISDRPCPLM